MGTIKLGYGHSSVRFDFDDGRFDVLGRAASSHSLTDGDIGRGIDNPIESPPLEELFEAGDTVLIVASDATRATGSAQITNLLVRRLVQAGVIPSDIAIIFATGIHRPVTREEKLFLLTPFIAERIRTLDHNAYDHAKVVHRILENEKTLLLGESHRKDWNDRLAGRASSFFDVFPEILNHLVVSEGF